MNIQGLTRYQLSLWFEWKLYPHSTAYNLTYAFELSGALDVKNLENALQTLVERYSSLRTYFEENDNQPQQIILPSIQTKLEYIDASQNSSEQIEASLKQYYTQVFDLKIPPLFKYTLIKAKNDLHYLVLNFHSIIIDETSAEVFIKEFSGIYNANLANQELVLPSIEANLHNVIDYEKNYFSKKLKQDIDFWQNKLKNAQFYLPYPEIVDEPIQQNISVIYGQIPATTTTLLKNFSKEFGTDIFFIFMAILKIILYRYSHQNDITITYTKNIRPSKLTDFFGYFTNLIFSRLELNDNQTFKDIIQSIDQEFKDNTPHTTLSILDLSKTLQQEQTSRGQLASNITFGRFYSGQKDLCLTSLKTKILNITTSDALNEFVFFYEEQQDVVQFKISFNHKKINTFLVKNLLEHFKILLESFLEDPNQNISTIHFLSAEEKNQLALWNNTEKPITKKTIIQLFEEQAKKTPNNIALLFEDQTYTYQAIDNKANHLANYLHEQFQLHQTPLLPNTLINIYFERSAEMVIAMLGILKAGAAYVPIDINFPAQRIQYVLADSQPKILLTLQKHIPTLNTIIDSLEGKPQIIALDQEWSSIEKAAKSYTANLNNKHLMYILYTSGSTGNPKGVMLEHEAIVNRLCWMQDEYQLTQKDTVLQKTPYTFDVSVWEFFWPLITGARLVVAKPEGHKDPHYLAQLIQKHHITTIHFVPPMLDAFLNTAELDSCTSLLRVFCSGEALSFNLQKIFNQRLNAKLYNLYGPTEAAIDVSYWDASIERKDGIVPIGKPISNIYFYVLDKNLETVPIGILGELYIGGIGLARGYIHRPELTAEKFISNPLNNRNSPRLYKTGDLVRWLPDGNLEYFGRTDDQVKIRGFRIELGEIEAQLTHYPQINQCVVLAKKQENGDKRLVAYLVLNSSELNIESLRDFLKQKLPEYMIPSAFVKLNALPLTANGKIDKKTLLEMEVTLLKAEKSYTPPQTEKEKILVKIWADVLKQDILTLGIHENFFELGGDSILSLQIIAKVRQAGLKLAPQQLFNYPTVASLAPIIDFETIRQQQDLAKGKVPLTPIQYWFFARKTQDYSYFNQEMICTITGAINPSYISIALNHLIDHHDALRLRFFKENHHWQQNYLDHETNSQFLHFENFDLSSLSPSEQEKMIRENNSRCRRTLHIEKGPIVAAALYHLGTNQYKLFISIHHLVIDGVSWRILVEDLETIYLQLLKSNSDIKKQLPVKTASFKKWATLLKKYAHTEAVKQEYAYWLQQTKTLKGNRANLDQNITVDYPENLENFSENNLFSHCHEIVTILPAEETYNLLHVVPPVYHTQINDSLLTALVLTFNDHFQQNSLALDLEGHGREDIGEDIDLSRTVGWFTTIFPINLQLQDTTKNNIGHALRLIKEQLRNIPNKGIGYGVLKYLSADKMITDTLNAQPKPAIIFNYLGQFGSDYNDTLIQMGPILEPQTPSMLIEHLIEITGWTLNGQLHFSWLFSKRFFNPSTIENLSSLFQSYLNKIIIHCQKNKLGSYTPADFPLIHLNLNEFDHLMADSFKTTAFKQQDIEALYPLTPLQKGLLFHELYDPSSNIYFVPLYIHLKGNLNYLALYNASQWLVKKYGVLRTGFIGENLNEPLQFVLKNVDIHWKFFDLSSLSEKNKKVSIQKILLEDSQKTFNLKQPPLIRFTIIQTSETDYLFVWGYHHIILDGWSAFSILLTDLFSFYQKLSANKELLLSYAPSFQDYIAWLQVQNTEPLSKYWQNLLHRFKAPTQIVPHPEQHEQNQQQKIYEYDLSFSHQIQKFCRENHITMSTLLHGVWAHLLHRYSNETDVIFGSIISGRSANIPHIEKIAGLLINTIPVRSQQKADQSVLDYLQHLQEQLFTSQNHGYLSLTEIQALSEIPQGTPLFQTLLVFENFPPPEIDENTTEKDYLTITKTETYGHTHYELGMMASFKEKLSFILDYDTSLYTDKNIEDLYKHFTILLQKFIETPQHDINKVSFLTPEEKNTILYQWNDTTLDYPRDKTITQLFEDQVLNTPDRTAVIYENIRLSYHDLNIQANQLAHHLQHLGVSKGTFVGVALERSSQLIVAFLAILKSGGIYLPIELDYPDSRLSYIFNETKLKFILTEEKFRERLTTLAPQLFSIDLANDRELIETQVKANFPPPNSPSDLAYIIYTSGSTGNPKGVAVSHKTITNLVTWQATQLGNNPKKITQFAAIGFDVSIQEMGFSLVKGHELHIVPSSLRKAPIEFVHFIVTHRIEVIFIPTSLLEILAEEALTIAADLKSLKTIIVAGEALKITPYIREFFKTYSYISLINHYGPTETHVVTSFELDKNVDEWPIFPSIGKPIANTQIYLLDPYLQPVAPHLSGELYIGGVGLAQGYIKLEELTRLKFVTNPFQPSERLYKTGDLAYWTPEGYLQFVGRTDDQIKIRGFRIELAEIESWLQSYPGVLETVVLANKIAENNETQLIAYLTLQEGFVLQLPELQKFLEQHLPRYMIPSAFVTLSHMPLTVNGKIDKKALLQEKLTFVTSNTHYAPARSVEEQSLIDIWANLLKIDAKTISIHDNFFALGGHSLLAMRLIAQIRNLFQVNLSMTVIFENTTIADIMSYIHDYRSAEAMELLPPLLPRPADVDNPLTFSQERLWFLDRLQPNHPFYNISLAWELTGPLDLSALEQAIHRIIERHESLRTVFIKIDNHVQQKILPFDKSHFVIDITTLNLDQNNVDHSDGVLEKLASEEAQKPFDLIQGPLLRIKLYRISPKKHLLLTTFHHIIADGWSISIFWQEMSVIYQALISHKNYLLEPLPIQYADYAYWQRINLNSDVINTQLSYWKKQLHNLPILHLPLDFQRPKIQTYNGQSLAVSVSPILTAQIKDLSQTHNVTLFTALFSVFSIMLNHYTGQQDIAIGTSVAGRTQIETEDLIGLFINSLVLRSDLSRSPTFTELLKRNHRMILDAFDHQDTPFEKIVDSLIKERNPSYTPLFQVMFVLQNTPGHVLNLPNITAKSVLADYKSAKVDISLELQETQAGLAGIIEYNTDLFKTATIHRMWEHFIFILSSIINNPRKPIETIPLLTPEENKLLTRWNDTKAQFPKEKTLIQLFEEQAEKTPDKIAVNFEGEHLTYRELNNKANLLAHFLHEQHYNKYNRYLPAETLIAMYMERSLEMVIGILGILKSGGAYVPIDPHYPMQRTQFILSDSKPLYILTQTHQTERLHSTISSLKIMHPTIFCLDSDWASIANTTMKTSLPIIKPKQLIYVIYTSGSTGNPKGVMLEHQSIVNRLWWMKEQFPLMEDDVTLQKTPYTFDVSVWEFFWPLITGTKLIIAKPEGHKDPFYLIQLIQRQKITNIHFVPSLLSAFLNTPDIEFCSSLRRVFCSGEALTFNLQQQFLIRLNCHLYNLYGPTEAAIEVSFYDCSTERSDGIVPIGKPISNVTLHVLNSELKAVPIGTIGELHIGGIALAREYLNRPELSIEKFIKNPLDNNSQSRFYKTGDLVRWLPDGHLEYLGRSDDQVKIRGFRIELGEIEAQLRQYPNIRQCVVLAKGENNDKKLVAYFTLNNVENFNLDNLHDFLKQQLPDFMVPSAFVRLDEIPINPSGKIDKRALLLEPTEFLHTRHGYIAPRNEIEFQLVKLWEELLDIKSIGINDNFFALGGNSLLSISLVTQIKSLFNKDFPIAIIFEKPTIKDLASLIAENIAPIINPIVNIQTKGSSLPFFCVHPVAGTAFSYLLLSEYLGDDQPFYGIQDPSSGTDHLFNSIIEEMASSYITAIKNTKINGPFILGGWSLGGLIAYEMAQQLLKQGDEVSTLIMIDTLLINQKNMERYALVDELNIEQTKQRLIEEQIIPPLPKSYDFDQWLNQIARETVHREKLMWNYTVKPYLGQRIALIKAYEKNMELTEKTLIPGKDSEWIEFAPQLEVYYSSGIHETLVSEPHVKVLAAIIRHILNSSNNN